MSFISPHFSNPVLLYSFCAARLFESTQRSTNSITGWSATHSSTLLINCLTSPCFRTERSTPIPSNTLCSMVFCMRSNIDVPYYLFVTIECQPKTSPALLVHFSVMPSAKCDFIASLTDDSVLDIGWKRWVSPTPITQLLLNPLQSIKWFILCTFMALDLWGV